MKLKYTPEERIRLGPDDRWISEEEHEYPPDDLDRIKLVVAGVRRAILQEPYVETEEVTHWLGVDDVTGMVGEGDLLAFQDYGDLLFPKFQFDPETHQPREVCRKVNKLMGAPDDGWGVTGWWIQRNGSLPEAIPPKQLLGTPSEYVLPDLAAASHDHSY
ncbi:MAG TPA: hypothetical protein VF572_06555 [Candidatus Saccharimonadales bacterium]|jgi:hypothetical protein